MRTLIYKLGFLSVALFCTAEMVAQDREAPREPMEMELLRPERPSVYNLVNEVRDSIGLDHSEFDKVYDAYQKFNKSVFGDESLADGPGAGPQMRGGGPGGMHPGGGPGGGMGGPGGGMGGPGGGPGGGMGGPGGGAPPSFDGKPGGGAPVDPAKLEKKRVKAEAKLCKTIKKTFKGDPGKYEKWLSVWEKQVDRMLPPMPPTPPENPPVEK